jgi:hypothetical protein
MSVTHWVRDTKKRYGPYTLSERELADVKALVQHAESSDLESSTRPGVPDSVKWAVFFKGKDGLTTYRIWEQDARKKAELRQLAARLGTLVRTYTEQQPVGFPKAEKEPVGNWKKLYEDEPWYKNHKQPEQVFRGTLQRHQEPEFSILQRPHRYKLGDRFIYPGKEHPELEKLVGQEVEVRGKRYDVELEGQSVREIWPAAVRAMASVDSETATLAQALDDWIVLLEANKVETAQKRWAKASATADEMKQWWTKLGECHKQYDYRKWLERAERIEDATQFKVGGHSFGHMHVDWEKTDEGWRIGKVWICR